MSEGIDEQTNPYMYGIYVRKGSTGRTNCYEANVSRYLSKFKWNHLTEKVAYDNQVSSRSFVCVCVCVCV